MLRYVLSNGFRTLIDELFSDTLHPKRALYKATLRVSKKKMDEDLNVDGRQYISVHTVANELAKRKLAGENNCYVIYIEDELSRGVPEAHSPYSLDDPGE